MGDETKLSTSSLDSTHVALPVHVVQHHLYFRTTDLNPRSIHPSYLLLLPQTGAHRGAAGLPPALNGGRGLGWAEGSWLFRMGGEQRSSDDDGDHVGIARPLS